MTDATVMQEEAEKRHQEVLNMIEALSDSTSSDGASFVCTITECIHGTSAKFNTDKQSLLWLPQ
jgi:hypothetical protein